MACPLVKRDGGFRLESDEQFLQLATLPHSKAIAYGSARPTQHGAIVKPVNIFDLPLSSLPVGRLLGQIFAKTCHAVIAETAAPTDGSHVAPRFIALHHAGPGIGKRSQVFDVFGFELWIAHTHPQVARWLPSSFPRRHDGFAIQIHTAE